MDGVYSQLRSLATALVTTGAITILVAMAGGYLLARKALFPVGEMVTTAARITASKLDERLVVPNHRDELGNLASTLNTMIDRLQQAIEETRRFTADAAHELRTPLAVMQTEAEVALRSDRTSGEYRKVVEVTLNETRRLARLSDQLLQLCRHDEGSLVRRSEKVHLDALLADVVDQLSLVAKKKSIRIEHAKAKACIVNGDDTQLSRVFYNVLENAIKYSPSESTVQVSTVLVDEIARVTVTDNGPGIPKASIPQVFDRFYRADVSRTRNGAPGGAGLGLAISKAIMDAHGGAIRVESRVNFGTTVVIEFSLPS